MQALLFSSMVRLRKQHLTALDTRTQALTEVVRNLHSIKLFAYESMFAESIGEKRKKEAELAAKFVTVRTSGGVISDCIPAIAAVGKSCSSDHADY